MLSILPFDRLSQREADRPFKSYANRSVSIPSSFYPAPFSTTAGMDHLRQATYDNTHYTDMQSSHYNMSRGVKAESSQQHYGFSAHVPSGLYNSTSGHMGMNGHLGYSGSGVTSTSGTGLSGLDNGSPSVPPAPSNSTVASPLAPQGGTTTSTTSPPADTSVASSSLPDSSTSLPPVLPVLQSHRPPPKKRANPIPEEQKDDAYWEKRKKNNDSAKRSRDQRRQKEEAIAMRVVYLEQENLQLRTEVSLLKSEIEKLRCMLYTS